LVRSFEALLAGESYLGVTVVPVSVSDEIVRSAAALASVHGVDSMQAIHLASAFAAREVEPECDRFLTADGSFAAVASRCSFSVPE
jgi:hypothetical protein